MLRAVLVLLLALSLDERARAEEGELSIAAQPLYGQTTLSGQSLRGGGGALGLGYGLTDTVTLQILGGVVAQASPGEAAAPPLPQESLLAFHVGAGVVYAFDIVRVVPFFEACVGLLGVILPVDMPAGMRETALNLGLGLGVGGDYLIDRRWSVGVGLRYHTALTDPGRFPLHLTVGPRVSLRLGLR